MARVRADDFGSYLCVATNQWGEVRHEVVLGVKSRPEAPSRVEVTGSSYNSVSLAWRPGFR